MCLTGEVQAALAAVRKGLAAGRLAHAYLVSGDPRGDAGHFAEELLATLFCAAPGARPCRECPGCRRIMKRAHPDLAWIEPQKKSRTIQMEQIQEVQQRILQTALEGGWKAVVLADAERLNDPAANKLLKLLEEPPEKSLFLLLSAQPEYLLPTVVSRCQRVRLSGEAVNAADPLKAAVLEIVAAPGEGGLLGGFLRARRMLELLARLKQEAEDEEKAAVESEILAGMGGPEDDGGSAGRSAVRAAIRKELEEAVEARIEGRYRERRAQAVRWLLFWCRDVLCCVCGLGPETWHYRDAAQSVRAAAAGLSYRRALANLRRVEELKDQLEQSLPEAMVLERALAG